MDDFCGPAAPWQQEQPKLPKKAETPILRHNTGQPGREHTSLTWFAVEMAEHLGTGHCDGLPDIRRAPAGDVVPDTRAGWKER